MSSSPGLTDADVTRILHLIDNLHNVEVRIEVEGMKLHVRKLSAEGNAALPQPIPSLSTEISEHAPAAPEPPPLQDSGKHAGTATTSTAQPKQSAAGAIPVGAVAIRAPMLGRFFRAASPTDAPFVEIGSKVSPDDTVCIIEVMKLFNTVKAGVRGTVIDVAIENGDMVEYDSVLFLVRPE